MAENLIFNEPALAFVGLGNGLFVWQSDTAIIPLTAGETYIVEWDGERHSCVAVSTVFDDSDAVAIGNFGIVGAGEKNGMPFLMGTAVAGDLSLCYTAEQDTANSVIIYHVTEEETGGDSGGTEGDGDGETEPEAPEETREGIILKNRKGDDVAYYDIETLTLDTTAEGKQQTFTKGVAVEGLEIVPDFSAGDMAIVATEGTLVKSAVIRRPESLVAEKIAEGEYIAGVGPGTFKGGPDEPYIVYTLNDAGEPVAAKMIGFSTIPAGCFAYMESLASVDLTESPNITSIGEYAFYGCSGLTNFTIPDSVTSIGINAFRGCTALTSITIPDGVTVIPNYAFYNCKAAQITIPDTVTSIGTYAFFGCQAITSFNIPDGVTSISAYAFQGCTSLASITIPDGLTSIGDYAFQNCTSLITLLVPGTVEKIGNYSFYACTALVAVCFLSGIVNVEIGVNAFNGCTALDNVSFSGGVSTLGNYAFRNCTALTSIVIRSTVTSIGYQAFSNCTALTSARFENTSGWWRSTSSTATSGTTISSSSLANTTTAATYLRSTYVSYYWHRS